MKPLDALKIETTKKIGSMDNAPISPIISIDKNLDLMYSKTYENQVDEKKKTIKIDYEDDIDESDFSKPPLRVPAPKPSSKSGGHFFIDVKPQWESINRQQQNISIYDKAIINKLPCIKSSIKFIVTDPNTGKNSTFDDFTMMKETNTSTAQ